MIRRAKRQTKKRHSVQRDGWITSRYWARRLADQTLGDLSFWSDTARVDTFSYPLPHPEHFVPGSVVTLYGT